MPSTKACLHALSLLALLAAAQPAQAAVASLVRDITPQGGDTTSPVNPVQLAVATGRLYFAAYDDERGYELWTSDGTVGGTEVLATCPGKCNSSPLLVGATRDLSFWMMGDPSALWRSDGTRAGTFPLIGDVLFSAAGNRWAVRGEVLFFLRCEGLPGCALWRTDGTPAGTREVLDLPFRQMALAGGRVLLATANELWRLDPGSETPARVAQVGEIGPTFVVQGRLLMVVSTTSEGDELWSSDGTAAGTRALTRFANRDPFGHQGTFVATGRRLYFVADDIEHGNELWASDGTPGGTRRITEFGYYFPFKDGFLPATLQEIGERVVFGATDGLPDTLQLWTTDGRPESTTKLSQPCPRECNLENGPYRTARVGNAVLFIAVDDAHGIELWTTDGTPKGTRLLRDLCPGSCDSDPAFIPAADGGVYLTAQNHVWRSDGTAAGTRRLTRQPLQWYDILRPQITAVGGKTYLKLGDSSFGRLGLLENGEVVPLTFGSGLGSGSDLQGLFAQGDVLHFVVGSGSESGLWRSAGSAATTRLTSREVSSMEAAVAAGGVVYFFDDQSTLWRVTDDGALRVADTTDTYGEASVTAAALGSHLYFDVFRDGVAELWRTDGTTAGTVSVLTFPEDWTVGFVAAAGGRLYIRLYDAPNGIIRLWTSDGTAAGTRGILVLPPYEGLRNRFVHLGGVDYFVSSRGVNFEFSRLWRTDGTTAGTHEVPLATEPFHVADVIAHDGSLVLLAEEYDDNGFAKTNLALWRVDGDTAVRLRTFGKHPLGRTLRLVSAGGLVLFTADDGEHGLELWATDGTSAGTRLVRDIARGPFSAGVSGLTVAGGKVFFTAQDNVHGIELWESDGTGAGTRMVHDVAPGPRSSAPTELTPGHGRLYFTADDALVGRELWTLPLIGGSGCQPSAHVLCLQGGRFRVEASWRDFQANTGEGTAVGLTGDTGYFWFFDPANAEVIVKVLDGRGLNGHFWVFYGALTTVEYALTVTDTQTGVTQRYANPLGHLASVGDTTGFGPAGAFATWRAPLQTASLATLTPVRGWTSPAAAAEACVPGPRRLCLNGGRFAVEAAWKDFSGKTGKGTAVPLSADTGYLWFFDAANVEVLVKVLDGTPLNGNFWVFYGALSSVEYTLTVTDTRTGEVREYRNASGQFASVADTGAFPGR